MKRKIMIFMTLVFAIIGVTTVKADNICDESKFKIKFDVNGGNELSEIVYTIGNVNSIEKLPIPTKEGYTFEGWYYDSNLTEKVNVDKISDIKTSTVKYGDVNGDGFVDALDATQILRYAEGLSNNVNLAVSDVNGDGKTDSEDANMISRYSSRLPVAASSKIGCLLYNDVNLYVKWVKVTSNESNGNSCAFNDSFKIKFDVNGGNELSEIVYTIGNVNSMEKLPIPTKEGYTFEGWYYDSNLTEKVNVDKISDIKTSTVKYGDVNGDGSVDTKDSTQILRYVQGLSNCVNLAVSDVNGDGKTDSEDADMILNYSSRLPIAASSKIGCLVYNDVNLYAKWVKLTSDDSNGNSCVFNDSFKIKFNVNGGNELSEIVYTIGNVNSMEKLPIPTKEGYTFEGWYYDSNLTEKVNGDKILDIKTSTDMYGDVDGDGTIDAMDASQILRYEKGLPNNVNLAVSDVNGDGKTNSEDANIILNYSSRLPVAASSKIGCLVYNDVNLYAKWKKEIVSESVSVFSNSDSLYSVAKLQIKKVTSESILKLINKVLTTYVAYDIDLLDINNEKIQPNGKVFVKMLIPEKFVKERLVTYRIDGDKLIEYPFTIDGEYAIIETDHFSIYILGEVASVSNPNTVDNILLYLGLGIILFTGAIIIIKKLNLLNN